MAFPDHRSRVEVTASSPSTNSSEICDNWPHGGWLSIRLHRVYLYLDECNLLMELPGVTPTVALGRKYCLQFQTARPIYWSDPIDRASTKNMSKNRGLGGVARGRAV